MIGLGKEALEERANRWTILLEKYESRAQHNGADCAFSEVTHKHFIKTKRKKRKHFIKSKIKKSGLKKRRRSTFDQYINDETNCKQKVNLAEMDVSDIIDEDNDTSLISDTGKFKIIKDNRRDAIYDELKTGQPCIQNKEVINCNHNDDIDGLCCKRSLENLIRFIEINLNSNLKDILTNRRNSLISKSDDYGYWHQCMTEEVKRLQKYITRSELKEYVSYCNVEPINDSLYDTSGSLANDISKNSLTDLIHFIEKNLNSNLKEMLVKRSELKILEVDEYNYWHKCTKDEMKRLRAYVTKTELKEYMKYCNNEAAIKIDESKDTLVHQMSDITKWLVKREFARNDRDKYLKYYHKIYCEWQRLLSLNLNINGMILYASSVINSVEKNGMSSSSPGSSNNLQFQNSYSSSNIFSE